MENFVVYVLYSKTFNKIYIGYTANLIQRFYSHNYYSKKGHTIKYRPWIVIYTEFLCSKKEALEREKQLKSFQGRKWIRSFIEQNNY